jgi:diguanylate cyclase (GGDEF)-like protein
MKQFFWLLAIPLGLIATALSINTGVGNVSGLSSAVIHYLPYLTILAALVLCVSFNQSRLFFVLLLSGLFLALLVGDARVPAGLVPASHRELSYLFGLYYAMLVLVLVFLRDRGLLTLIGVSRLLLVLAVPLLALYQGRRSPDYDLEWLKVSLLPDSLGQLSQVPDLVLIVFVVASLLVFVRLILHPTVVESSVLGLLIAVLLALHVYPSLPAMEMLLGAGAVTALLVMLRNSFYLAYLDELTGLPARRALQDQMLKLGRRYSIAMLDVDHFKKFNDRYGHDIGDQVLQMVGAHLMKTGGGSKGFRYGGEEFTLVFAGKNSEATMEHLEKLRQSIADAKFVVRGKDRPRKKPANGKKGKNSSTDTGKQTVQITISIGVADNTGEETTPEEVIKAADKALYRAKKKGRNQVSV